MSGRTVCRERFCESEHLSGRTLKRSHTRVAGVCSGSVTVEARGSMSGRTPGRSRTRVACVGSCSGEVDHDRKHTDENFCKSVSSVHADWTHEGASAYIHCAEAAQSTLSSVPFAEFLLSFIVVVGSACVPTINVIPSRFATPDNATVAATCAGAIRAVRTLARICARPERTFHASLPLRVACLDPQGELRPPHPAATGNTVMRLDTCAGGAQPA
jgi:hypothetical protein